jgi:diguanylate cyclase (GGDEF)-like protein
MKTTLGIEQLLELSLFRGELPGTVEWLLDVAEERTLQAGELLLPPDARNDTLYLIIEGALRVELKVLERPVISHIGPGECVGELSVLDGRPTAAYVVADCETRLLLIDRESLWRLIFTSHVVAKNLLYTLSSRVRRDNEALGESLVLQHLHELNARTDALTGLYNRFWLQQMLPRLVERAHTGGEPLGLMLLDADHFKRFNDSYGHLAGDEALRVLGTTVMNNIRPNDSAVRYGGEEIVVLLPGAGRAATAEAAERIRKAVALAAVMGGQGQRLPPLTVSIGVAMLTAEQQGEALLAEADRALYRAKAAGRDRVVTAWEPAER